MDQKHNRITDLRWGLVPYTSGSGLHIGAGEKVFPNAIGINDTRGGGVHQIMPLGRLPTIGAAAYDWVFIGNALQRVDAPRELLAEAWRVLAVGGFLSIARPTSVAAEWLAADAPDHALHACLALGSIVVTVFEKLAPGSGKHVVAQRTGKTLALVRPGAYGDALWATSILPALKAEGYHITVYTEDQGAEILAHDPLVDALIVTDSGRLTMEEWHLWWAHEMPRYDRWINLNEVVEKNLLAVPNDLRFYWPDAERRKIFDRNYLAAIHDLAGVPRKWAQRFAATEAEILHASTLHTPGRKTAVVAVSGSTLPKFWPYVEELAAGLIERGYAVWLLGDMRDLQLAPREHLHAVGKGWPMRQALAFAQQADVVIGQETAITNAVAYEKMRKVVLLSHSTVRNLTQTWVNTVSLHGDVPCWPCHRVHYVQSNWAHCTRDEATGQAKCQATISAAQVLAAVDRAFVIKAVA